MRVVNAILVAALVLVLSVVAFQMRRVANSLELAFGPSTYTGPSSLAVYDKRTGRAIEPGEPGYFSPNATSTPPRKSNRPSAPEQGSSTAR